MESRVRTKKYNINVLGWDGVPFRVPQVVFHPSRDQKGSVLRDNSLDKLELLEHWPHREHRHTMKETDSSVFVPCLHHPCRLSLSLLSFTLSVSISNVLYSLSWVVRACWAWELSGNSIKVSNCLMIRPNSRFHVRPPGLCTPFSFIFSPQPRLAPPVDNIKKKSWRVHD